MLLKQVLFFFSPFVPLVIYHCSFHPVGLPQWLRGKEFTGNVCDTGDSGLIPVLGSSPGGGHGIPLQYSCLGNVMDRGVWWATVHVAAKSWPRLSGLAAPHHHSTQCIESNPHPRRPPSHVELADTVKQTF